MSQTYTQKRVIGQNHLSLHYEDKFNGLPVYRHPEGLVISYLQRLYNLISGCICECQRIFAVRIDLHFPFNYAPFEDGVHSNEYLQKFMKNLRALLRRRRSQSLARGCRVYDVDFEYVWARECGGGSENPHFHLVLIFDGNAFRGLGSFHSDGENLCGKIGEAWAGALGLHPAEGGSFVHFPEGGQYQINAGDQKQFEQLFFRASYLTKVATKNFNDRVHVFGVSRRGVKLERGNW